MANRTSNDLTREAAIISSLLSRIDKLDCEYAEMDAEELFLEQYEELEDSENSDNEDDEEIDQVPRMVKIFDVRTSNLWRLASVENTHGFDCEEIESNLFHKFGINSGWWRTEDTTEFVSIGRKNVWDYSNFKFMKIYKISMDETTSEKTRLSRKSDPKFFHETSFWDIKISQKEHSKATENYNGKLSRAIKAQFLFKAAKLSEDIMGHIRGPFHEPVFCHELQRNLGGFDPQEKKWLTQSEDWLPGIINIPKWAESQFVGVGSDIFDFFRWMKTGINEFREFNKLENEHYWTYERAEPTIYIEKLHKLSALNRMMADMSVNALREVFETVQELAHDLGKVLQSNLEQ